MTNNIQKWQLNDGNYIPSLGFGTYQLKGNEGATAIEAAINSGYRLLDSAYNYENEGVVGEGIRRSSVPREELVVTSKLPGRYHRYEDAVKTIQESLYRTNLNYYDIYLIHWPNPSQDLYVEAWQALIDAKKWGLIRSIGVCNFLPEHLKRLKEETGVVPAINQIELHPFFNQEEQRKVNDSYNIITQAWSPLYRAKDISDNQILKGIADKYDKSVPQVILRWHYQLGNIAIPKSANPNRQLENKAIFDFKLNEADMMTINGLTQENGRMNDQDPAVYEEY
ncbi:aldo/keto reductase [Paraliobacillus ryukyuensis]|uniref:aldo/keto reductase n=1 Tax=Paraliobacillus ryukyuensis TaxID=200904 RepID=UPI0009A877B0|nr:aldo/keto reductase [Paraliobacillus ryukyuensis]